MSIYALIEVLQLTARFAKSTIALPLLGLLQPNHASCGAYFLRGNMADLREEELAGIEGVHRRFGYRVLKMEPGDGLPFDPRIELLLNWYTTGRGGDIPLISPDLMTDSEIDVQIENLKKNLDALGVAAKAALALAKAETRAMLSTR